MEWLIYGANGYTGELIAREAARRGLRPILAGRSGESIEPLARELGLDVRIFALDRPSLDGVGAVLHCAGPFIRTSGPMIDACLANGAHYLDITGEIAVFEQAMRRGEEARRAGIALVPGVGFDVVPTDCMAAMLGDALPGATELLLAFFAPGASLSRGTLMTMIEGLREGGAIRRDGRIVRVPVAYEIRDIPYSCGVRTSMTVPWGDVSTAFHTTGIPSIRVYTGIGRKGATRMRRLRPLLPILGRFPLKQILQTVARRKKGPDQTARAQGRSYIWGHATNEKSGQMVTGTMDVPEGYAFTVLSALAAMEHVLRGDVKPGAWTPSRAFGKDLVREVPGVVVEMQEVGGK
jgi:short subunit dehydrogenase-like uncharacterized protein